MLTGFIALLICATAVKVPGQRDTSQEARADDLMRMARVASGGEDALHRITSLSASVQLVRHMSYVLVSSKKIQDREARLKGTIQIEFQTPDRFRKRVSIATLLGYRTKYVEVVNGSRAWRDPPLTAVSSSRKRHVIDVSDFERSLAYQAQGARQQLTFYALALTIKGFPEDSLKFRSEGWVQQENGKAEVISVFGPDDFHAGLLLDQATHLPLSVIQDVVAVRPVPVLVEWAAFGNARQQELIQKARRERAARLKPAQRMRVEYRFTDRRLVDGISFPHRITTLIDGKLVEEMMVSNLRVNPRLNPKDFEPKPANSSRTR